MTVNSDGVVLQIVGGPVNVTVMVLFCKLSVNVTVMVLFCKLSVNVTVMVVFCKLSMNH